MAYALHNGNYHPLAKQITVDLLHVKWQIKPPRLRLSTSVSPSPSVCISPPVAFFFDSNFNCVTVNAMNIKYYARVLIYLVGWVHGKDCYQSIKWNFSFLLLFCIPPTRLSFRRALIMACVKSFSILLKQRFNFA